MKKLLIATVALAFALPVIASAEPCAPRQGVVATLAERFDEHPRFQGMNERGNIVELFLNEQSGTWTAVVTTVEGLSCLLDAGQYMELVAIPPNV